jgi:general secretion pathway protein J
MISSGNGRSNRSQMGFTLLEIILAITLIALMAVGIWAVLQISVRSWTKGTEYIDANQRHRSVLDLVRKQIASTYALYSPIDPIQGGVPTLIFSGAEASLTFISLNSLHFQESPGLTLVSYEFAPNFEGGFSLIENEQPYLGQEIGGETAPGPSIKTQIFENLSSCLFEYFDPGDAANPAQWVTAWDGQNIGRLPSAVSLTITSPDPKGRTSLNRQLIIPLRSEALMRGNIMNSPFPRSRTERP